MQRQPYDSLRWRNIGPHRGGRVSAVVGHPTDPLTFYFGACAGGVWKTENGGVFWQNVSDGFFGTASVGALAVAESNPNVVLAGMGEANIRGNVSYGDGVYGSTDGGRTWRQLGLAETRHIGRIRIHPKNENLFYVAALGHAFGPNSERGVFRSKDGGKAFEKVLYVDENTGSVDISMDPLNPDTLYAAMWQVRRTPYSLSSGGPGSSLYRSKDGGDTWENLSGKAGFPDGLLGRIGVAASGARAGRVYALVEAAEGGMLKSDDWGESWKRVSDERIIRSRAWYFSHIVADPVAADTVYALNGFAWKSENGGESYVPVNTPHVDNHDLWIDPRNPRRMIEGNDGGACVSFDGGSSWSSINNQPTGEFYHVTTDSNFPYRVYGSQQDNTTISIPSRSRVAGITERDWYTVGGGESGYIAVREDDPNIVFSGSSSTGEGGRIDRYDHRTRQLQDVSVWPERTTGLPAEEYTYRFQWTSPISLSPHDQRTLYSAGNHVFRSADEGLNWEMISPDLTRNDASRLTPSGGPINKDQTGVEVYCTVFALAESPRQPGLLWAGTDDGLVHVTGDGGESWHDVTPKMLPDWSLVTMIEPSHFDADVAYVAATGYKNDDTAPYIFRTNDRGATWNRIDAGLPDYVRAVREDPECRGLLYAGTETGIYVSLNDGKSWNSLRLNLPVVAIHDFAVRLDDLVVATHGRGFWILDDVTPLRQLAETPARQDRARLFAPRDTYRVRSYADIMLPEEEDVVRPVAVLELASQGRSYYLQKRPAPGESPVFLDAGQNPVDGVLVRYVLPEGNDEPVTLTFQDADGEVRTFSSMPPEGDTSGAPLVPAGAGAHSFTWDMRYPAATKLEGLFGGLPCAPVAAPGRYRVILTVGDQSEEAEFTILKDPSVPATDEDLRKQFDLLVRVRDAVSRTHEVVYWIQDARREVQRLMDRTTGNEAVQSVLGALLERMESTEGILNQTHNRGYQDMLKFSPRLNAQFAHLFRVVSSADAAPTKSSYELYRALGEKLTAAIGQVWNIADEINEVSGLVAELESPRITPPPAFEW